MCSWLTQYLYGDRQSENVLLFTYAPQQVSYNRINYTNTSMMRPWNPPQDGLFHVCNTYISLEKWRHLIYHYQPRGKELFQFTTHCNHQISSNCAILFCLQSWSFGKLYSCKYWKSVPFSNVKIVVKWDINMWIY